MTDKEKCKIMREEMIWFLDNIPCEELDWEGVKKEMVLDAMSVFIKKLRLMFPDIFTRYHRTQERINEFLEFERQINEENK